ncbi:Na+/H+ antiporter NhaA [Salinimicrobium catena]|uniref:Na+/H+ antiporter NhaA n=1 Tax=Salinimicrobium catena TaxID=390640 RepID=UPI002FE46B7C
MRKSGLDVYLLLPIKNFIEKQTSVGLLLIFSATLAVLFANSPWRALYHDFWEQHLYIGINDLELEKSLLHWINDGLMSIFFFMVGLELKREIIDGHLASVRGAVLPIAAALGGMIFPALIYFGFNTGTGSISGWGIPMATDIAFALGILFLLGKRVPLSLKVFLTAIAIVDDMGAVLVIALFYTADLAIENLVLAGFFLLILMTANQMGIRSTWFYAIMGIGGLWMAIMLSGVHATIAAVLVAFTIPNSKKINTPVFLRKVRWLTNEVRNKYIRSVKEEEEETEEDVISSIEKFTSLAQDATPPLQRLEHALYPFVSFVVLPLFAFANAGVTIDTGSFNAIFNPVTIGVVLGLIAGKFIGIVLFTRLMVSLKISELPTEVTWKHIYGIGFLGAIGFTMSLFITELAFEDELFMTQAKIGIILASVIAGTIGFFYLKGASRRPRVSAAFIRPEGKLKKVEREPQKAGL